MWRFVGYRPHPPEGYREAGVAAPPDEPQYEGVVYTDGTVALRWRTEYRSTSVWESFEAFYRVHGHPEYGTYLEWPDGVAPVARDMPGMTTRVRGGDTPAGHAGHRVREAAE
jgi:hypothetical protein